MKIITYVLVGPVLKDIGYCYVFVYNMNHIVYCYVFLNNKRHDIQSCIIKYLNFSFIRPFEKTRSHLLPPLNEITQSFGILIRYSAQPGHLGIRRLAAKLNFIAIANDRY